MDCLFCKIIDGEIPSNKVYEDDMMLAFRDINPQAPEHIVIVPKCHIASANEINAENVKYVAAIWEKIPHIASEFSDQCTLSARVAPPLLTFVTFILYCSPINLPNRLAN